MNIQNIPRWTKIVLVLLGVLFVAFGTWVEYREGPNNIQPGASSTNIDYEQVEKDMYTLDVVPDNTQHDGYNRTRDFGSAWKDVDGNSCDTRNDILARDLVDIHHKGNSDCTIQTGTLEKDPYTGSPIVFQRGRGSRIDIDHVIPLKRAWNLGAWQWPREQRVHYANDPEVLISVDSSANRSKGDKGIGEWMPSYRPYWCEYSARYVHISKKYQLPITQSDKAQLEQVLPHCKG